MVESRSCTPWPRSEVSEEDTPTWFVKADVDLHKRAGELTQEELERIVTIMQNPTNYKIPAWFLNRQKDQVDGKDYHVLANNLESKLRDDLERLKKIRAHRGIRHFWGLKVRGQHTKTTSRGR